MRHYRRHIGKKFSEGARLLWQAIEREDLTFRAAAQRVGALNVARWLYGDILPPLPAMVQMAKVFNIPIETWLQKPHRPFKPPAARARLARTA